MKNKNVETSNIQKIMCMLWISQGLIPWQELFQESENTEDVVHVPVQIQDWDRAGDPKFPTHVKQTK